MIYLSCLVCQPCLLGLNKGSGLFISILVRNQPQGSFACFFCSWDSSFQVTVLHESTSNSTFPVVQTKHWTLIIVKCFVFKTVYPVLSQRRNHLCPHELTLHAAGLADATALCSLPSSFWMCIWSLRVADRLNCCARNNTSNLPSQGRQLVHILWCVTKQHIKSYRCDLIWNLSCVC